MIAKVTGQLLSRVTWVLLKLLVVIWQACIESAKHLNAELNTPHHHYHNTTTAAAAATTTTTTTATNTHHHHHHHVLRVDAELSLLKVSQLERVHFHRPSSLQASAVTCSSWSSSSVSVQASGRMSSSSSSGRGLPLSASAATSSSTVHSSLVTTAYCCIFLVFTAVVEF